MNRAVPNLPAADLMLAKAFYVEMLGFSVVFEAVSSDGDRSGLVGLEREGMRINVDAPMDGHGRLACVSLEVEDLDGMYEEWSERVTGIAAPVLQEWGARTFELADPDGNTIFVLGS
jgi:catechol 2,3-dioxygenase-like lactoylglutathione lyase family enzyme